MDASVAERSASTAAGAAQSPARADANGLASARRHFWLAFALYVGIGVGLSWDRAWHATHPFRNFFSPPHYLIYAMVALTTLAVLHLGLSARLRVWFGPGLRVPFLPFEVPGAILLTAGALLLTSFAGLCDLYWHSRFGLDETSWSFPHDLLGWGLDLTFFGLVACRLALARYRPIRWYTASLFGLFVLGMVVDRAAGPIVSNRLPVLLGRIASLRVLAGDPAVQHAFRIYLKWDLTRLNPLLVPLGALGAGAGLATLRSLTRHTWLFLAVVAVTSLFELANARGGARSLGVVLDNRAWLPLPLLPAALVLVLVLKAGVREYWGWAAAGLVFGLLTIAVWGAAPIWVLSAIALMPAGALLGNRFFRVLESPNRASVALVLALGVAIPFLLGFLDLYLRHHTT
jgi:hypothetical protein